MPSLRSLFRHTAVYGLGDLLGRAVGVLLLPLYAQRLSPAENGVVSLGFAFIGFCSVLYALGVNQALLRVLSGWDREPLAARQRRFSSGFWFLAAVGVLLSTAMALLSGPIARAFLGGAENRRIVELLSAVIALDSLSEPFFTLCRARQQSGRYALVRLLQNTLQILIVLYLLLLQSRGVEGVFEANLVSSAFALLAMLPSAVGVLRLQFCRSDLGPLLRFGLNFVPTSLSMLIISLSDRFLVEHYLGLDELGVYSVACKLGIPMLMIVRAFRSAWAPGVLSESGPEGPGDGPAFCARVTTYFVVLGLFVTLASFALSRQLLVVVAGANAEHYVPARHVVPLATFGYVLYGIYVILTAGVYAEGRAAILPVSVGAGAVLNIAVNVVTIPSIGYIGATLSTVMANALMILLLYAGTRRFYPVPFEYRRLGKVAVAAAVVFSAIGGTPDQSPGSAVGRGILLLAFPLILWGWRFLEPAEWSGVKGLLVRGRPAVPRPGEDGSVGGKV